MCPHDLPGPPVREASFYGMIRYCETGLKGEVFFGMTLGIVKLVSKEIRCTCSSWRGSSCAWRAQSS